MIQVLKAEDPLYEVEVTLDHPTVITFYAGLLANPIAEAAGLHTQSPINELFFRPDGPGLYKLTVSMVDGRAAVYNFYAEDLQQYTLSIDGAGPWQETEALKLPDIRRAFVNAHNTYGVSSFKLTYKVVGS